MRISVVIPSWNRKKWLVHAIDSVLTQKCEVAELIVVDDGSTDNTFEFIKERYGACELVKVIRTENKGVSAARNLGIRSAHSEWVAFLDSDDRWHKNKLQEQVALLKEFPYYRIVHTAEVWVRNGTFVNERKKHYKCGGWIFPYALSRCRISPSAVMIHKSVFDKVGYFDESMRACEDYDLWLRILMHYPIGFVPKRLTYKYGGHKDQLSNTVPYLDTYRVRSLQKVLELQPLPKNYRDWVVATLEAKLKILVNGFRKHGKEDLSESYAEQLRWLRSGNPYNPLL